MRIFKVYSRGNFQTCHTMVATLYIASPWHLFYNWEFVPFGPLHPVCLPPPPASKHHQCVLCIDELVFACLFLNSTCKWDHMVSVFLWLISLSMMPLRAFLLLQMARFHSFSFFFLMEEQYSIRPSIVSFYTLAVVNIAAVNIGCIYFFKSVFSFSLGKYPEVKMLADMVVLF